MVHDSSIQPFYWDRLRDTTLGRYLFDREYAFIKQALDTTTLPSNLLEICCGSGRITLPLHKAGLKVVGIDIDQVAIAAFQRRSTAVPLIRGNALRLPFNDSAFDCIVAIQCFQYFDHHQFLLECNRVLCANGLLIFQSLNGHSYKSVLKRLLRRTSGVGISGNLSCREVLRATADYGFTIQAVSGYNWAPFARNSDSAMMGAAVLVEQALRLDYYYAISPWILVAARKTSS